jgi:hypothetical protein
MMSHKSEVNRFGTRFLYHGQVSQRFYRFKTLPPLPRNQIGQVRRHVLGNTIKATCRHERQRCPREYHSKAPRSIEIPMTLCGWLVWLSFNLKRVNWRARRY